MSEEVLQELDKWDDSSLVDAFKRAMAAYPHGYGTSEQTVDDAADDDDDDDNGEEEMARADARFSSLLEKTKVDPETGYGQWQSVAREKETTRPAATATPFPATAAPPVPPLHPPVTADQDGMSDLLASWYYAGYYTGRYQAIQEMRAAAAAPRGS